MKHIDVQLAKIAQQADEERSGRAGELEYLITELNDCPVIAVRGTELSTVFKGKNWKDVVRDLRVFPWYDANIGWAHAGMLKGAKEIYFDILNITRFSPIFTKALHAAHCKQYAYQCDSNGEKEKLYVTGHSLGSGVGFLLAKYIYNTYSSWGLNVEFVGLGTPNIMVSDPAVPFPARFYRNGDDVVTELLGRLLYKKFPHIQVGNSDGCKPISDHRDLDEYIQAIEAYLELRK